MKRSTKVVALAAALALSVGVLAGCTSNGGSASSASSSASSSSAAETAPAYAAQTGKLIVGFDSAYPPYGFVGDDGQYTGFDLDLATEVAQRNNWEVQLEAIDWDAKDALLGQGSINCIWNGFTMEGREADYQFSQPYMLNEQVVVVKKDAGIGALTDLAGKNVITQVDSAALEVLEGDQSMLTETFANLDQIGDYNNAFMQLESGMVDAVACDLSIAAYQMAAKPDAYVMIEEPLSAEHYAVGFKLGDEETASLVNSTLLEMYQDGTIEKLCQKYAEYGLSFDNWVLKEAVS